MGSASSVTQWEWLRLGGVEGEEVAAGGLWAGILAVCAVGVEWIVVVRSCYFGLARLVDPVCPRVHLVIGGGGVGRF